MQSPRKSSHCWRKAERRPGLEHSGENFFTGIIPARAQSGKFLQVQRAITIHAGRAVVVQAEVVVDPENIPA